MIQPSITVAIYPFGTETAPASSGKWCLGISSWYQLIESWSPVEKSIVDQAKSAARKVVAKLAGLLRWGVYSHVPVQDVNCCRKHHCETYKYIIIHAIYNYIIYITDSFIFYVNNNNGLKTWLHQPVVWCFDFQQTNPLSDLRGAQGGDRKCKAPAEGRMAKSPWKMGLEFAGKIIFKMRFIEKKM